MLHTPTSLSARKLSCWIWVSILHMLNQPIENKRCAGPDVLSITCTTDQTVQLTLARAQGNHLLISIAGVHETVVDKMHPTWSWSARCFVCAPVCITVVFQDPFIFLSFVDLSNSRFRDTKLHANVTNLLHKTNDLTQASECCNWRRHTRSQLLDNQHHMRSFSSNMQAQANDRPEYAAVLLIQLRWIVSKLNPGIAWNFLNSGMSKRSLKGLNHLFNRSAWHEYQAIFNFNHPSTQKFYTAATTIQLFMAHIVSSPREPRFVLVPIRFASEAWPRPGLAEPRSASLAGFGNGTSSINITERERLSWSREAGTRG